MSYTIDTGTSFDTLLAEIAGTRTHYEALRSSNGSFDERAITLSRLHTLRARMAELRRTI